jgi:outer membrane protein assembly factor BamB
MSGNLYAVDIATGKERWRYRTGTLPPTGVITGGAFPGFCCHLLIPDQAFYGSPVVGPDGSVYIGSMDFNFYAINGTNGTPRWAFATSDRVLSTPAVGADGTVYLSSSDGGFYALETVNGRLRWRVNLNSPAGSAVTLGPDGVVYVGTDGGKVYAIQGGGQLADSVWPMYQQNVQHTGRYWPPDPSVVIWRDGNYVRLRWETGILQAADDPSGPWREVPDAKSPRFLRPSESRQFYRTWQ